MNDMKQKIRQLRLTAICIGLVALLGLSIYSAHILLNMPKDYHAKPIMTTSKMPTYKTPVTPTIYTGPGIRQTQLFGQTSIPTPSYSILPAPQMSGTSSMHLYTTSSATVHTIGGGGSGGGMSSSGGSSGSRGIHSTATSYGNMLALAASVPLASPGASEASSMAHIAAAPERKEAPSVRRVSEDPLDPFLDPIGDVVWGWMLVLVGAYGYHLFWRQRPPKREMSK